MNFKKAIVVFLIFMIVFSALPPNTNIYAKKFNTPTNITLSTTKYVYNQSKVRRPRVTIKNKKGKTLKNGTDYTLEYQEGRCKVGKYKITIRFKGKYSGIKKVYFKIVPRSNEIKKITPTVNGLKIKWSRRKVQTTGYQLAYSTGKSFDNYKIITIKDKSENTTKLKNLNGNKTYYLRIRTYKTVNGKVYYSKWSKVYKETTKRKKISVPFINQNPQLPTGCEITSAAMVLQYYGENVKHTTFAESWIKKSSNFYYQNGKRYGPDPSLIFAGNPASKYSYGCFAPVIANAVNKKSDICKAEVIEGKSLSYLCRKYIDNGKPLLIWATISMVATKGSDYWYTAEGKKISWPINEHCLVLVDYDDNYYYFNDPLRGKRVAYSKSLVNTRYKELNSQAVYIDLIK